MTKLEKYGLLKHGYDHDFLRQMLARFVMDCEYYLGYGSRHPKHLWTHDEREIIDLMKEIHSILREDVDGWCPLSRIESFEERMITK